MKFLGSYLSKYKKESLLAPLFKMLEAIFELFVPLVMASIIDVGIAGEDTSYILSHALLLLVLALIGVIVAVTAQYFAAKAAIYTAAEMREDFFCHSIDFSAEQRQQIGTSVLTTRITSDINQVQNGVNMFLRLFLRSPFIVIGAFVMAAAIDTKATGIFAIVIGLLVCIVYFIMHSTLPIFATIQKQLEKIILTVGENLEGVRVIRAFGNQEKQKERFDAHTEEMYELQMHSGRISALLNPLTYVVVNLGIVVLLYYGGSWVETGALTRGEVVALVNYMSQILVELLKLANLIVLLMRAVPSVARIQEVMEQPTDERIHHLMEDEPVSQEHAEVSVCFDHVGFVYPGGGSEAVSDVSFILKKGESLGIIGGTGSGKSTLLRLLQHDYDVTSGSVRIDGRNVANYTDEEISEKLGPVLQKAVLFTGTIRENIVFGREGITDAMIEEAILAAQAADVIGAKEAGLDEMVLQDAKNFSGGQRQRLTIARALANQPEVILLDDASSALDAATDANLRRAIAHLSWHPSMIIVSQRASSVMDADRILALDDGRVVGYGTHEELMSTCELYREIYGTQFAMEEKG